jgi:hypothetical protein
MGIASILFAPSSNKLVHDLNQLAEILESGVQTEHDFITDMQLLGSGLNAGILGELPTLPQHAWSLPSGADSHKVIFDGLAYGQYLFGQDPLHSGGMRVSGHRNEHFPFDPSGVHWESSDKLGLLPVLQFLWQGTTYELANVHVHSKECVSSPDGKSDRWNRVFAEANEAMPRMSEGPFTDEIHSQTIPFADRIRISYRSGKIRSLIRLVTEKIGLVRAPRRKR